LRWTLTGQASHRLKRGYTTRESAVRKGKSKQQGRGHLEGGEDTSKGEYGKRTKGERALLGKAGPAAGGEKQISKNRVEGRFLKKKI